MQVETFVCNDCGAEFEAFCFAEFEHKQKMHKCQKISKKKARTRELEQQQTKQYVKDAVVNDIEQHNFNALIEQGVICCGAGCP